MSNLSTHVQQLADQCVRCGLCLPHCPTYLQTEQEGESPRGRIALWQGLASQQLSLTPLSQTYLDHCLACRACETVCPAEVSYEKLLIAGRALQTQLSSGAGFLQKRIRVRWGIGLFLRLPRWLKWLCIYGLRIIAPLPVRKQKKNLLAHCPEKTPLKNSVVLFKGCIHSLVDPQTFKDSMTLLQACNYRVQFSETNTCCGAWYAHQGENKLAAQCHKKNHALFKKISKNIIISTATGCTEALQNTTFTVEDIGVFLLQTPKFAQLSFAALNKKALVHIPCTQRHGLKQASIPITLLKRIPQLNIISLRYPHCCGGAGSYFLEFPQHAAALVTPIIAEIKQAQADIFVTSNVGCALHLSSALKEAKMSVAVVHPINLLAQQLMV